MGVVTYVIKREVLQIIFSILIIIPIPTLGEVSSHHGIIECPGLPVKTGVNMECVSTKFGQAKFNCSRPMPVDTIVYFSCQPYFKELTVPTFFDVKSLRCNQQGRWARYNYFNEFKCEYECGRALPSTKTTVVKGQLKTRTTWPWHVLIYLKLNWAKVLEAMHYRRTLFEASANTLDDKDSNSTQKSFTLDPIKLAEIFDNDDLSREEIFDPRYRYIFICGGTLVSENMVLTAAHCLTDNKGQQRATKDFMVVLGGTSNSFQANVDEPKSQVIPVSKIHISDAFNYDEYRADIGIMRLQQPAVLNSAVLPACLPENKDDAMLFVANRKHGEAVGSMINIYKEGVSNELKSKKLKVLPNMECLRNIQRIPSDAEFCAGSLGVQICSGDSGAGLIASPNFGLRRKYTVQGIISYATSRRICEDYAVFTRVHKYMNWIKNIVNSNITTVK